jgi:ATP-binding protein involved in chromosome partitioning
MGELKIKKEDIIRALSTVQEPDLKQDLITLNMIKDIELGVGEVRFASVASVPLDNLRKQKLE